LITAAVLLQLRGCGVDDLPRCHDQAGGWLLGIWIALA
jgi:hypothetical protein